VLAEYVKHQSGTSRPADATLDIGAYEFRGNRCDRNQDGQTNEADVQHLISVILSQTGSLPQDDLNQDGKVDVADVQFLVTVALGLAGCPA
jgi:hypothetical protein